MQNKGKLVTGAVIATASTQIAQPRNTVDISARMASKTQITAVADKGAMVCIAGPRSVQALGLKKTKLTKCDNLRAVAGHIIYVHGYHHCKINLNGNHSYQLIYFIPSAKRGFLSLTACKELKLIRIIPTPASHGVCRRQSGH